MQDQFANPLSCSSPEAIRAYDRAVDSHLHALPGVSDALDAALAAQPDFALPHALRALVDAPRDIPKARESLARAAAAELTPREQSFVDLVALILQGRTLEAMHAVLAHSEKHPTDALAASTALGAYGLIAFSGRADHDRARLDFLERLAPHYPQDFAWLLTNRGWARIECGDVGEGLTMTLRAMGLRRDNGHNAHHLMHGYYETGDPEAALAFLEGWLPDYPDHALMWGHLQWHAALAELELGRDDAATRRLMGPILSYLPRGLPFMGLADIASILWRMQLRGLSPLPWEAAHAFAARHFAQGSNAFGEIHLAMLAAQRADREALDASMVRLRALEERGYESARAAVEWVRALQATLDDELGRAREHIEACRREVVRVGGSHAQRGIVDRTLEALG